MIVAIAIQGVCCVNKTLALNGFSDYFSHFSVRTIVKERCRIDGLKASPISQWKPQVWSVWESGDTDMFVGDAGWDAPCWRLQPFAVSGLLGILEELVAVSPGGLTFSMSWVGDQLVVKVVTLKELRMIIKTGKILAKTEYQYRAL